MDDDFSWACPPELWMKLREEDCFPHFYDDASPHSRFKLQSLTTFLSMWLPRCRRPVLFDLYAGCGGHWSRTGSCVRLGSTARFVSAALDHGIPLGSVFAAERLESFHAVLTALLADLVAGNCDSDEGGIWAQGNLRLGPWGRELLTPMREALSSAESDVFLLADQFGHTGVNVKLLRSLSQCRSATASLSLLLFVGMMRVTEESISSTFGFDSKVDTSNCPPTWSDQRRWVAAITAKLEEVVGGPTAHALVFRDAYDIDKEVPGHLCYALVFASTNPAATRFMHHAFRKHTETHYSTQQRQRALGTAHAFCVRNGW